MPFDAQLAIAALDFNGFGYSDHPDLSVLRARYPELERPPRAALGQDKILAAVSVCACVAGKRDRGTTEQ